MSGNGSQLANLTPFDPIRHVFCWLPVNRCFSKVKSYFTLCSVLILYHFGFPALGCGITMLILSVYMYFVKFWKDNDLPPQYSWIPVASIYIFVISCTLGYLIIPWVMIGEVYPTQVRLLMKIKILSRFYSSCKNLLRNINIWFGMVRLPLFLMRNRDAFYTTPGSNCHTWWPSKYPSASFNQFSHLYWLKDDAKII